MFILALLIITIILFIISIYEKYEDIFAPLAIVSLIVCCICLFICMISIPISSDTISKMEAFYNNNNKIFVSSIEKYPETAQVISSAGSVTVTTIQYQYLKMLSNYNQNYTWYKKYQHNFFLGSFVLDIPENLTLLELPK